MKRPGLLLLCVELIAASLAFAQSAGSPELKPVFSDDFSSDTRPDYVLSGSPRWTKGEILLGKGDALARKLDADFWAQAKFSFGFGKPILDKSPELRIWLTLDGATNCFVRIRPVTTWGTKTNLIALVDTDQQDGNQVSSVVRERSVGPLSAKPFTVEYRHGLVHVRQEAHTLLLAHIENNNAAVVSIGFEFVDCEGSLRAMSADAMPLVLPTRSPTDKKLIASINEDAPRLVAALRENSADAPKIAKRMNENAATVFGKYHTTYSTTLNNLATVYQQVGEMALARKCYQEALEIRRRQLGEQHPRYAVTLQNLAAFQDVTLQKIEARRNYEKALKICEAVRGSEHPQYAEFLNSLGALHQTLGDYHEARVCLETSRKILFKHKPKSPTYAVVLNNLGMVLESLGLYEEAEESYRTSVGIREENKARAADYSRPLNNLGDLLEKRGAYQEALVLLRKSLAMRKPGTPEYAVAVNNLAGLYHSMGDYNRAIGLYKEALRIRRMTLEPEHPHYADSLNNIAGMLSAAGRYKGAIEHYQQALKVYEKSLGKDSPECGTVLNNMALTLTEMGKFKDALDYLNRTRVICLKRQGRKSRPYVTNSHNIASVWAGLGEYELAESECRKAIRMRTKLVGERHPDVSNSWNMLGSILHRAKRYEEAGRVLRRASDLRLRHLELISSVQSMRQQVGATKRSSDFFSLLVENALAWDGADDAEFATELWRWKGMVTSRQRAYRVAQGTVEHSAAFRRFYKTTQQLAMASLQAPKGLREDASASEKTVYAERHRIWVDRVNKLTEERERHEEALAGSLSEFRELRERLTVEEVCQALPPDSCLIDFFEYRRAKIEPGKTIQYDYRYAALVVRKDGFIKLVDLKSVDEMDKAIAEFRRAFTGKEAGAISVFSCGKSIRDRLWRPLEQYLAGVKTVLVSPDMAIGTVPFAAIPDKGGKYLVESYAFCTLPLTAALRTMAARRPEPGLKDLLIVGDVDYGKLPGEANQVATRRSGQPREGWSRLDGSGLETDALESFWWRQFGKRPTVLREGDATEARFAKEAPRHRNIFLSTHGYFDEPVGPNPIGISDMASPGQRISVLAPGLLTGFVLANANNPKAIGVKSADGILTASEIEALRLKNVDLVFVAGCETGLGKAASGEGLASIQRGFYVAGVGSCVAALWAIDDEATLKLTREFCRNCWGSKRLKKIEALRQAQLKVLRDPNGIKVRGKTPVGEIRKKRTHPYYWAAFQLSGDWR